MSRSPCWKPRRCLRKGFAVDEGAVLVSMNPTQQEFAWHSSLPRQPSMTFTAPVDQPWREVWLFDIGNAWNVEFEGDPGKRTRGERCRGGVLRYSILDRARR